MLINRFTKQPPLAAAMLIALATVSGCKEEQFADFLQTTDDATLIETCQDNRGECLDLLSRDKYRSLLSPSQVTALCLEDEVLCTLVLPKVTAPAAPSVTLQEIAEQVTTVAVVPEPEVAEVKVIEPEVIVPEVAEPVFDFTAAFNAINAQPDVFQKLISYENLSNRDELAEEQQLRLAAAMVVTAIKAGEEDKPYRKRLLSIADVTRLPTAIQGLVYWAALVEGVEAPRTFNQVSQKVDAIIAPFNFEVDYEQSATEASRGYLRAALFEYFTNGKEEAAPYILASIDKQKITSKYLPELTGQADVNDFRSVFLTQFDNAFNMNPIFTL